MGQHHIVYCFLSNKLSDVLIIGDRTNCKMATITVYIIISATLKHKMVSWYF